MGMLSHVFLPMITAFINSGWEELDGSGSGLLNSGAVELVEASFVGVEQVMFMK